jgi:guanosine-3',5'-bis(diphosphate) 3'-pyrophosphohydrolase
VQLTHITDVEVIGGVLLYGTVEDTETTPEELEDEFGTVIKKIVMDVTDDKTLMKHERISMYRVDCLSLRDRCW